jgi:hypothetical protein
MRCQARKYSVLVLGAMTLCGWVEAAVRTDAESPATALVHLLVRFGLNSDNLSQLRAADVARSLEVFGVAAVEPLEAVLRENQTARLRRHVYTVLGHVADATGDTTAIAAFSRGLGADEDGSVRSLCVDIAGAMTTTPEPVVSGVSQLFNRASEQPATRAKARTYLARVVDATQSRAAIVALCNGISDPNSSVRVDTLRAVKEMNTVQPDIATGIAKRLCDGDGAVRIAALNYFADKKGDAAAAVETLGSLLTDETIDDVGLRQVLQAVEYVGPAARSAEATLTTIVADVTRSDETRYHAARALAAVQPRRTSSTSQPAQTARM